MNLINEEILAYKKINELSNIKPSDTQDIRKKLFDYLMYGAKIINRSIYVKDIDHPILITPNNEILDAEVFGKILAIDHWISKIPLENIVEAVINLNKEVEDQICLFKKLKEILYDTS